ncbi:bifunctional DedA family/phosphatase PAP2 family protein [Fredinandcohnia sp. QZ13]|uniref:bifunctional DedA family/phosphatase PAP2 family protein n=1 Tax=Fredinandcohnia sp. QZ13 TaxID=3073144 RepID=UPI002852FD4E|nr:bifunctional DedA family/phosphatase PAP2 family protein [Fredinandcohnia sp. QZ13]MDR4887784.1 bifunctional DedA family/phosphatase PAP2 family protein [Fredinandcohnia sp. QZ13]
MDFITTYLDQHGYLVLFFALLLELLALPIPGEVVMGYAGYLVYQGRLNWFLSILVAGLGSSIGMTISYWIGFKLGSPFFEKHGHRIHLGPERLQKVSQWFTTYGNKVIMIAYYIPGVRHITGYFSGITQIPFRSYVLFAYGGAFIWVSIFISLGKILGPQWEQFHGAVKKYLVIAGIIAAIVIGIIYVIKKYKTQIKESTMVWINKGIHLFHTQRRTGVFIVGILVITLGFVLLMIGMIQDFLANEFVDFNEIVVLLVPLIFDENWEPLMVILFNVGMQKVLIAITIVTFLFILWKGRNKLLESLFLLITIVGGELYEEILRRFFHQISPNHVKQTEPISYSFPSEQSLMAFVIYGFFIYILVRHINRVRVQTGVAIGAVILFLLMAISRVYFEIQLPSDIVAGYVFGGLWLSMSILLLESFRLMRVVAKR